MIDDAVRLGHAGCLVDPATGQEMAPSDLGPAFAITTKQGGFLDVSWSKPAGPGRHGSGQPITRIDQRDGRNVLAILGRITLLDHEGFVLFRDADRRRGGKAAVAMIGLDGAEQWTIAVTDEFSPAAMIAAGEAVIAAGTLSQNHYLWIASMSQQEEIARIDLPGVPVPEGLAAGYGNRYIALADGQLLCFGTAGD